MLARIVRPLKVLNVDHPRSIPIELLECQVRESSASLIHLTDDGSQELIIVDGTRTVSIEKRENLGYLWLVGLEDSVVLHGFTEFRG